MNIRLFTLLVVAVSLASVASACASGGGGESRRGGSPITMWMSYIEAAARGDTSNPGRVQVIVGNVPGQPQFMACEWEVPCEWTRAGSDSGLGEVCGTSSSSGIGILITQSEVVVGASGLPPELFGWFSCIDVNEERCWTDHTPQLSGAELTRGWAISRQNWPSVQCGSDGYGPAYGVLFSVPADSATEFDLNDLRKLIAYASESGFPESCEKRLALFTELTGKPVPPETERCN